MATGKILYGTTLPQWKVSSTAKKAEAEGLKVRAKLLWRGVIVVEGTPEQVARFKANSVPHTRFNKELYDVDRFIRG